MTFQTLEAFIDFLAQVHTDSRRQAVTDLLCGPDDFCDDLADRLDWDRARFEAEMATWRVETRQQLAALPIRFPLTVDFTHREHDGLGWQPIGRVSPS